MKARLMVYWTVVAALVLLKLSGIVTASWPWVLAPVWLPFLAVAGLFAYHDWKYRGDGPEGR